jgi:parallel beta-helix repeat protein
VSADDVTISGFTVKGAGFFGIYLSGADHCIISDNKVSNNSFGISLHGGSSGNTFTSNTVSNNSLGFDLLCSSGNELTSNIVSSNSNGIHLQDSSGNELTSNTVNSNTHYGIKLHSSSNNNELTGNTALNSEYGIYSEGSSGNTLTSNTANSNNYYGIRLYDSSGNTLTDNTANNNDYGIGLGSASNNKLTSNTANSNNACGIVLHDSSGNTLTDNPASNNNQGILLYYSSNNNKLTSNTASNNNYSGIGLLDSSGNTLMSNTASNNGWGIYLQDSSGNTLMSNTVSNNCGGGGIALRGSSDNTLTGNIANSNTEYGISLVHSNDNILNINNPSNNDYGIYLDSSSSNKIYLNNFIDNTDNVYSEDSTNTWNSPEKLTYTYNDGHYTNYLGNYWDDYIGSDANNDGIGDTHYPINSDDDNFPLMARFENYVGEDTTPPTVTSVSPEDGATEVAIDTVVTATFSEAMDSSTLTTRSFTLAGTPGRGWEEVPPVPPTESTVSGTLTYDSDTYTATFTPDTNLEYNHEYTATLSTDITDEAGNHLVEEYSWKFTTESAVTKTIYVDDDFIDDPANHKWNTIQEGVDDANDCLSWYLYRECGCRQERNY